RRREVAPGAEQLRARQYTADSRPPAEEHATVREQDGRSARSGLGHGADRKPCTTGDRIRTRPEESDRGGDDETESRGREPHTRSPAVPDLPVPPDPRTRSGGRIALPRRSFSAHTTPLIRPSA